MTALMHLNSQTASLTMTPERVKLVLKHADSALLLRKPSGQWDLPGGRRDSDEALQATLVREVYEETGMSVTAPVYLGDYLRLRGARPPVLVAFYGATLPKNWSLATLKL